MELKTDTILDRAGNGIQGAKILVLSGMGNLQSNYTTPAAIFDMNGNPISGSEVVTGDLGDFSFQAANGKYVLRISVRGTVYRTIGPLTFYDPADDPSQGSDLSGTDGATKVGYGTDTVAAALGFLYSQSVSVKDKRFAGGAKGDGVADDTTAIQNAIDITSGLVKLPNGTYKITQPLIIRAGCTGLIGEGAYTATIDKRFSGNAISSLTDGALLANFGVAGNGSIHTGGGILPQGYNTLLHKLRIDNTADSCVLVNPAVGSNATAATYLTVDDCFLRPSNSITTMAVRSLGVDEPGRPTCRTFRKISGGSSLIDFSGMNYASLTDSLGTMVKFSSGSGKIHMGNNRLTCQDNIFIRGVDHVISGNSWGFGAGKSLTLDAAAANVTFDSANAISIDSIFGQSIQIGAALGSGFANYVSTGVIPFPFAWYGTTTNPTIGNATTAASYRLSGDSCMASLALTVGSSTSVGAGTYTFQLPFRAKTTTTAPALVRASDGTYYPALFIVQAGGSEGIVYLVAGATAPWGSATLSFGAGASFNMTIQYPMATS